MANEVNRLTDLIRRKMVRPPNLRPKTKLGQRTVGQRTVGQRTVGQRTVGQRTVGRDPESNVQYSQLKGEFYHEPAKLGRFISYIHDKILTDSQILTGETGIYTWILKRGHMYATELMSNQEIGSLHANMDVLTLHQNNVAKINRTLKNSRSAEQKPIAAGELLLVRGQEQATLYFNLQSGTYSEPMLKCRATELGIRRGLNKKALKAEMMSLKMECRDELVQMVQEEIVRTTGLPLERVRFLSCGAEIQQELEAIPFLKDNYRHGACRDDDDYLENVAGRNLIRRFMAFTSVANQERFQTYFDVVPVPVVPAPVVPAPVVPAPAVPVLGKRKGLNQNNNQNQRNQRNQNTRKNKASKR